MVPSLPLTLHNTRPGAPLSFLPSFSCFSLLTASALPSLLFLPLHSPCFFFTSSTPHLPVLPFSLMLFPVSSLHPSFFHFLFCAHLLFLVVSRRGFLSSLSAFATRRVFLLFFPFNILPIYIFSRAGLLSRAATHSPSPLPRDGPRRAPRRGCGICEIASKMRISSLSSFLV